MKKNTRKVVRLTKGERLLYTLGAVCLLFTVVIRVFASASIGNLKMDIEKVSYRIDSQTKKNQSLVMQVNELTSYENLNAVLKNMGLAYNNKNIVVVK